MNNKILITLTLSFVFSLWLGCTSIKEVSYEKIDRYPSGIEFGVSYFDGDVIVFYKQGEYIIIKQCKDFSKVKMIKDCKIKENTFIRQIFISNFEKALSRALIFPQLPLSQMTEKMTNIFKKGVKEDIYLKSERLNNFLNEAYPSEENKIKLEFKELVLKIKKENSDINGINKQIKIINEKINTVVNDFIKSKKIHNYNYNESKISFIFNILVSFLRTLPLNADFSTIPKGSLILGSKIGEEYRMNDENQVKVKIKKSFEMMKTEVNQIQWFLVMGSNPSFFKKEKYCDDYITLYGEELCPNNPVEQVSRDDIDIFIRKLNELFIIQNKQVNFYDLPTSSEWEYSIRAGSRTSYFFGDRSTHLRKYAWYMKNSKKQTHQVGQKKKGYNKYGLYDVYGNVWELLKNPYIVDKENNSNLNLNKRSLYHKRGGSWLDSDISYFRSAYHSYQSYEATSFNVGFRLLRYIGRRNEVSEVVIP